MKSLLRRHSSITTRSARYGVGISLAVFLSGCGGGDQRTPFLWENVLLGANASGVVNDEIVRDQAGDIYRTYQQNGVSWLRKINAQGKTLWEYKINTTALDPTFNVILRVWPCKDAVQIVMQVPANQSVTLQRVSLQGVKLWESTLANFKGSLFSYGTAEMDAQDNLYLVDGYDQNDGTIQYDLLKISSSGATAWRKSLLACHSCFEGIKAVQNNIYYLAKPDTQHELISLDDKGALRWQQSYYDPAAWYSLTSAGNNLVMWSTDGLRIFNTAGVLQASQDTPVLTIPVWDGSNTLFIATQSQLRALDVTGNTKGFADLSPDTTDTRYYFGSNLLWIPEKSEIGFVYSKHSTIGLTESQSDSIEIYDASLTFKASKKGGVQSATTCGFPGCYIPKSSGDDWRYLNYVGTNTITVAGVKKEDGYYTGAYQLP